MGATKNNTGGTFENSGGWEKFKYEGHTKFLEGLKNRWGKDFRGPVTEGCLVQKTSWVNVQCRQILNFYPGTKILLQTEDGGKRQRPFRQNLKN